MKLTTGWFLQGLLGMWSLAGLGGWLGGGWERLPICLCYVVLVGWLSGGGEWWGGVCVREGRGIPSITNT